jgi:sulfur-oxidizing protein SoxB
VTLSKRDFLQVLGAGAGRRHGPGALGERRRATAGEAMYELPRFGNVSLLHMTDCHAQLLPVHFREPSVNLGVGPMKGQLPHLVGDHLLRWPRCPPARRPRTPSPTSTSMPPRAATARSAASRTWPRWSSA